MAWDIQVQDYPSAAATIADVPDSFRPMPIGTRADIIRQIREVIPDADFSDPSLGYIGGEDFGIEVDMGNDKVVRSFTLHVRGGDAAALVVASLLRHLRLRAFDTWTADFFDPQQPQAGLQLWRDFVAKIGPALESRFGQDQAWTHQSKD